MFSFFSFPGDFFDFTNLFVFDERRDAGEYAFYGVVVFCGGFTNEVVTVFVRHFEKPCFLSVEVGDGREENENEGQNDLFHKLYRLTMICDLSSSKGRAMSGLREG